MNNCGRCGREVYCSEQKFAIGKVWHTFCFSCYKCRKLLDNCSVYCLNGELFCCSCYYSCCCDPCCAKPCPPPCDPCPPPCKPCCPPPCKPCCPPPCKPCCPPPCKPCCPPPCKPCDPCCPPPRKQCDPCCDPCTTCCVLPCTTCVVCPDPCDPCKTKVCCVNCPPCPPPFCDPCCDPCPRPCCNPCDPCNPCCIPVPCRPCCDPCCCCCGKQVVEVTVPTQNYCLRKAPPQSEKCQPRTLCLEWKPNEERRMPRCRSCSPKSSGSPCRYQRPGSSCAAPTPRETNNYYSRNHDKMVVDQCKGSCYCPENCSCPHKGLNGRFACPKSCDPCSKVDCPMRCCRPKKCCPPPKCCPPRSPARKCCPPPKCDPCCDPCCMGPYCPPARKPICYPPVQCCEPNPCERICYYPCPPPCQPKYCTCGSPNPCDCDLNLKRTQLECERAPCCRRCGRKVYHAEKIMASGGAFHTCCFSCYCCHKPLEVTSVYESQGEIYCKHCYAKYFGIAGYGYGMTLQSPL